MNPKRASRPVNPAAPDAAEPPPEGALTFGLVQGDAPSPTASDPPPEGEPHEPNGNASDPPRPPAAPPAAEPPDDDPFDPARLRLPQDFAAAVGVRKLLTTVPVRKPSKEWYVRTHPNPAYWFPAGILELKEDRELYLIPNALWPEVSDEPTCSPRLLVASINRQGVLFVWPIRTPGEDGKQDDWSRSANEAAIAARTEWVRITANMGLGAYDIKAATYRTEPTWPTLPMNEILRVAFRDRMIDSFDHPVLRELRGEV
jgi:hypothetical protein